MSAACSRRVRRAAVAGAFYPADRSVLAGVIRTYLAAVPPDEGPHLAPKAIIVPHAAYCYSGPVAAHGYAAVAAGRGRIERVVLLGPAHFCPLLGVAASGADAFSTPLGDLAVDTVARDDLVTVGLCTVCDAAHAREHSIEVQLPFLQTVLGEVRLLPLVVGEATPAAVEAVLDRVWGGPETVIVVSSDLSHYHDRSTATRLDRRTAGAILGCRAGDIGIEDACGVYALRGLLTAAAKRAMTVDQLDLRTSADTAGEPGRVVGYGTFALVEHRQ